MRSMTATITCRLSSVNNPTGTYQIGTRVLSSATMDIYEIRRLRLRELIKFRYGGIVKRCAESLEMKPPQIHRWLSTTSKDSRRIEYDSARGIAKRSARRTAAPATSARPATQTPWQRFIAQPPTRTPPGLRPSHCGTQAICNGRRSKRPGSRTQKNAPYAA